MNNFITMNELAQRLGCQYHKIRYCIQKKFSHQFIEGQDYIDNSTLHQVKYKILDSPIVIDKIKICLEKIVNYNTR